MAAEDLRPSELIRLTGNSFPKVPRRGRTGVQLGRRVMIAFVRVVDQRSNGGENKVVCRKRHASWLTLMYPVQMRGGLGVLGEIEVDVGDLGVELECHAEFAEMI